MTIYKVDQIDESASVVHEIVDDGLTLMSSYSGPDGTSHAKVTWLTLELAEANYEVARELYVNRIPKIRERLAGLPQGEEDRSKLMTVLKNRHGRLMLYINTGPPTWWAPRFSLVKRDKKLGFRAGWLRCCFDLNWESR